MAVLGNRCGRLSAILRIILGVFLLDLFAISAAAGKDYYKILGVSKKADDRQIKRAYKKQAMKWHPDKHQKNKEEATAKFQEIAEAHEILTDPKKRELYDLGGEDAVKGKPPGPKSGAQGHPNANIDPEILKAFMSKMPGSGPGGNPFSFSFNMGNADVFSQMHQNMGNANTFSRMHQTKKPRQGGPLYADPGSNVREISSQSYESEIRKLQEREGHVLVQFYSSGGRSCPRACQAIKGHYQEIASSKKQQLPVVAVQCKKREGLCATYADSFPAVVLFSKTKAKPSVVSAGKVAKAVELKRSLEDALASHGASKSKTKHNLELASGDFGSNSDPCNGQFCLLLLERGSMISRARTASAKVAEMLEIEPVKVFYVNADKHPDFVEAFGTLAGKILRGASGSVAKALIYRPRRQSYEMFEGDVTNPEALAEFAVTVVHRGTALRHKVARTPVMKT